MFRFSGFTYNDIMLAARRAIRGHRGKKEVIQFESDFENCCKTLWNDLQNGNWKNIVSEYRRWDSVNKSNGKLRHIESPSLCCRIYQHLLLLKLEDWYRKHDNLNGLNCKKGCGICSGIRNKSNRNHSIVRKLKHIIYDRTDLHYALIIDQRKCYGHVHPNQFRSAIYKLGISNDSRFVDFAVKCSFCGKGTGNIPLPIGTPTSPVVHHIIMKEFDNWVVNEFGITSRFADDNILFFRTSEEAQAAKWRIQNYWWYNLKIRAKSRSIRILDIDKAGIDFCGYVFKRNWNQSRSVQSHNKGCVRIRKSTLKRIYRMAGDPKSYGSYFGSLNQADEFINMRSIENSKPNLPKLSNRIKYSMGVFKKTGIVYKITKSFSSSFDLIDYDRDHNQAIIRMHNKIRLLEMFDKNRFGFIRDTFSELSEYCPVLNIPPITYDSDIRCYIIPETIIKNYIEFI